MKFPRSCARRACKARPIRGGCCRFTKPATALNMTLQLEDMLKSVTARCQMCKAVVALMGPPLLMGNWNKNAIG